MCASRTANQAPRPRPSGRVVLIDEQDRVLLFKWETLNVWITPGGGLKPGETYEEAALRELREETSLVVSELGPWVWSRSHVFRWNEMLYDAMERFFLLRTPHFQVSSEGMEPAEREEASVHRWWSLDELSSSKEVFAPRRIAELLAPLVQGLIPGEPIETGS